ncbi:FecR family protein [Tistlia consotensis]|uniref:FecR family protein n=1 Tax=Tistlia consotensis USBA 355 TaxID=560819 RepID=A0A1Y6BL13_9PROT|nr:FecR domain-containing protein [Tistlia consotensis]SMF14619.1 FecR family protein [Tistlia consotensis USBA 355]SNR49412.1 FecR family protein [Tistlia consotensis]
MTLFTRAAPILAIVLAAARPSTSGAMAAPGDLAGISAAVRGDVQLTSVLSSDVRRIGSGEDVLFGDALRTAPASGLQLLLLDQSVFTIGADAQLVVDSFVYDPASGSGELTAELLKGAFRFVSGGLSAKDPGQVQLSVPEATIGVRGTIVSALVTEAGSYVLLDGPGRGNDAFERRGVVTVSAGGRTVELSRPGFATFVARGAAPLEPFEAPPELRGRLSGALAVRPGAQTQRAQAQPAGAAGGDAVAESGVGTTQAFATLSTGRAVEAVAEVAATAEPDDPEGQDATASSTLAGDAATGVTDSAVAATLAQDVDPQLSDSLELTALETLERIDGLNSSAVDHFAGDGSFTLTQRNGQTLGSPLEGTSRLSLTIDFGNRTLGDANSGLRVTAGDFSKVVLIDHLSFDEAVGGFALWIQNNANDQEVVRDGSYILISGKKGVASEASAGLILESGGDAGTAKIVDAPRLDGASPGLP